MLTKNKIKFVKSLHLKKYRKKEQSFIAEGAKTVLELLHSHYHVTTLICTPVFFHEYKNIVNKGKYEIIEASEKELSEIGTFATNNAAIAIVQTQENKFLGADQGELVLALDDVRDPGNLGTIIRIADWYNIKKIICSETTAELYNPKVINASMGSFTRVNLYYTDMEDYLKSCKVKIMGAYLEGEDIHTLSGRQEGIILMGNEAKGISPVLEKFVTQKIHIPRYGKAESLNVAIATAVICDNLRRGDK